MFAANPFKPATKEQSKLRMALIGPSGSGKTWTALSIASELGKVALIDTERGSASKYAGDFKFDVLELSDYSPLKYIEAIKAAAQFGYDVVVIDSLSHAWNAPGGVLDMVDKAAKKSQSNNSFAAWRDVTPVHNQLIDALVGTDIHLIATMRSKTEYVLETNERGKTMPRKVGLAPVQRDGMEYEFDIFAEMDMENNLIISKSRCSALNGAVIPKPGKNVAEVVKAWLSDGEPVVLKLVDAETGEITDAPAPAKPPRRVDTKPGTLDNGKPVSLFQYLMKTVDHLRYEKSEARAKAITKLISADILFDRMDRGEAVKLVNVYADLRDSGEESDAAIEAVRKLMTKPARGEG